MKIDPETDIAICRDYSLSQMRLWNPDIPDNTP